MKEPTIYFSDSIPSKWIDAEYALNPREILSLDRTVYGVVRHAAVLQKWLPTVAIPKGQLQREIAIAVELSEPLFTRDFMKEDEDEVRKKVVTYHLAAMHKDFRLNMIDIDASRNSDYYDINIESLNIREAALTIADYKERVLYRGYDILDRAKTAAHPQGLIDTNVKGLISPPTAAGTVNSFDAAGDNAGMDSAGDGPLSVGAAMASLIADEANGPYVFQMTPDIYGQLAQNFNSTTHISDIERMHAMIDLQGNKILEGMDVTKYLIKAASVADNGSMLMFQRRTPANEPTAVVLESYPVAHYPTQHSSLGIKGKVLWMGCAANLRPDFFTLETSVDLLA